MKNIVIHPRLIGLALTGWLLGSVAGVQAAGPWYVATNGADSGNSGLDWSQPFASISNAMAMAGAVSNETIWVSNGVYTLTASIVNDTNKACKIRAMSTNARDTVLLGPGSNTTTHASGGFRGVYIAGAGSLLQGFTVTNFYMTNETYGAGLHCSYRTSITNCIITGNILNYPGNTAAGAGIYIGVSYSSAGGGATIENCDIIGNVMKCTYSGGAAAGGIFWSNFGGHIKNCRIVGNRTTGFGGGVNLSFCGSQNPMDGILQDSVVASNTAMVGGGIYMGPDTIVSNCLVFANTASARGGGLCFGAGITKIGYIAGCVFSNNYGPDSGGIKDYDVMNGTRQTGNLRISNCIFDNNSNAAGQGVAILLNLTNTPDSSIQIRNCLVANNTNGLSSVYLAFSNVLIESCTIAGNKTASSGDVVAGLMLTNGGNVVNSIIYHNLKDGGEQANVTASADCTFSNSCVVPLSAVVGTGNTEADPRFVAKETGNFRLAGNSPCINTGMYQAWMTGGLDLDGRTRIRYGTVDMGAYECLYEGAIFMFH